MRSSIHAVCFGLLAALLTACEPSGGGGDAGQDGGVDPRFAVVSELSSTCETDGGLSYRLQCRLEIAGCYRCSLLGQPLGGGELEPLVESTDDCLDPGYCGVRTWSGALPTHSYSELVGRAGRCEEDAGVLTITDEQTVDVDGC